MITAGFLRLRALPLCSLLSSSPCFSSCGCCLLSLPLPATISSQASSGLFFFRGLTRLHHGVGWGSGVFTRARPTERLWPQVACACRLRSAHSGPSGREGQRPGAELWPRSSRQASWRRQPAVLERRPPLFSVVASIKERGHEEVGRRWDSGLRLSLAPECLHRLRKCRGRSAEGGVSVTWARKLIRS